MQNLIDFITGGSLEFTPAVMVGIIVFCIIFNGICMLIGNLVGGAKK